MSNFSSCYICLLVVGALFHLCFSNQNINDVLCLDYERQALVEFKLGLIDETGRLSSWVSEEKDCCKWDGIVCDNFTGHVHRIHLRLTDDACLYYSHPRMLRGNIRPSILALKQLKHLDLSCNDFGGIKIPSFMGSLGNLRYLNLSHARFGGTIPPQLGNLSQLGILCLGGTYDHPFAETIMMNMQWLSRLHMLHHLDLSGVDLSKAVDWIQVINILPSLVQLRLPSSRLPNVHPQVASPNLTSLSLLDLSENRFNNSSVLVWIFGIKSLISLDLSDCGFRDPIHNSTDSFRNLTSIKFLYIPGNEFMNSSLVLKRLSSVAGNLILLDMNDCGVSSSVLGTLHNLTSLLSLDLRFNMLDTTIPTSLANLCNLKDIDLAFNNFSNISFYRLFEGFFKCESPRLESLSLPSSRISSHLPDQLGELTYLVHLQMRDNRVSGIIPDCIGRLSFLRSLHLEENLISGPIPFSIGELSSLEVLHLSKNRVNGSIPDSLGLLSKLSSLDLTNNLLNGNIPYSLGQLSMLSTLDLSNNLLNGSIPDSLGLLSKLRTLDLSNNLLTGIITEAHFANLTGLKMLTGAGNNLTIRPRLVNWIPPFRLQELDLSSWDLGPQFPSWLQSQRDLKSLVISNTKISSTMPDLFLESFPNLEVLDMSENHIQGRLFAIPASLSILDLSSNWFSGQLPKLSGSSFALAIDLSSNSFTGSLHHLLCPYGGEELLVLNLANNHLSGVLPKCWVKVPNLYFLSLENNNLTGRIPRSLGFLSSLGSLNMCNNKLSGRLPVSLKNMTDLQTLQLARNELVGTIPPWFGTEFKLLMILNLRSNNFSGHIVHELCYLTNIQILDLAHNNLSGNIPRCFNNFSVLSGKQVTGGPKIAFYSNETGAVSASLVIKGRVDTYTAILGLLTVIDLSSNNFSGHIPSELMTLLALRSLNLSSNQLTGRIPKNIGDMKILESFDASLNKLSGELPMSFSRLSFLSSFNVSFNNLTGRIPSSTQFRGFSESSFLGNRLCGDPLTESCAVAVPNRDQEEDDESNGVDWGLIISIVSGIIAGFWIVVAPLIVNRSWRVAYFCFLSELRYMVCDLIHKYWCKMLHK